MSCRIDILRTLQDNVAWQDNRNGNQDIYARGVNGQGTPDPEFAIATGPLTQQQPAVAGNGLNNRYAVAWEEQDNLWRIAIAQTPLGGPVDWTKTTGIAVTDRRDPDVSHSTAANEWLLGWRKGTTAIEVQVVANNGDFMQQGKYTLNADPYEVQALTLAWNSA